eukprot:1000238-Rhodomonas_salina.1
MCTREHDWCSRTKITKFTRLPVLYRGTCTSVPGYCNTRVPGYREPGNPGTRVQDQGITSIYRGYPGTLGRAICSTRVPYPGNYPVGIAARGWYTCVYPGYTSSAGTTGSLPHVGYPLYPGTE